MVTRSVSLIKSSLHFFIINTLDFNQFTQKLLDSKFIQRLPAARKDSAEGLLWLPVPGPAVFSLPTAASNLYPTLLLHKAGFLSGQQWLL